MARSNEEQVTIILFYFVYVVIWTLCHINLEYQFYDSPCNNVIRSHGKYVVCTVFEKAILVLTVEIIRSTSI